MKTVARLVLAPLLLLAGCGPLPATSNSGAAPNEKLADSTSTRQQLDQQIHAHAANDAWGAGEALLDAVVGGAATTRQQADQRIHACASSDAWCVGEVLLDLIYGAAPSTPTHLAVTCSCDGSATLSCTVGTGANERAVNGSVYVGDYGNCARDQKDVQVNYRVCDSSATLWRIDFASLSFTKVADIGSYEACFQQAEQAP